MTPRARVVNAGFAVAILAIGLGVGAARGRAPWGAVVAAVVLGARALSPRRGPC